MESDIGIENIRNAALSAVHESATDAIISADHRGRILTFNPAAEQMFGFSEDEIMGQSVNLLMPSGDAHHHDHYIDRYLKSGNAKIIGRGRQVDCQHRNGKQFKAHLTIGETQVDGRPVFAAILHDLTRQQTMAQRARDMGFMIEQASSSMLVIDRNDELILFANATAREAWRDDRVVGRALSDIVAAESLSAFYDAMESLSQQETADLRVTMLRSDGRRYSADAHLFETGFLDQTAVVASVRDVSEQLQLAEALGRTKLEQTLILRYAPIGIVVLDRAGNILSANRTAERICGRDESEMLGRNGINMLLDADRRHIRRRFIQLARGHAPYLSSEHELQRPSGERVPIRTHNAVIHDDSSTQPVLITMFEDLTEERRRATELQAQRDELAHVSRVAQLGEMAVGLAHELNQPLTAIGTYAEAGRRFLNADEIDKDALIDTCHRIGEQSSRAGTIIRKVRQLARRATEERSVFDINEAIQGLQALLEVELRQSQSRLRLDLAEPLMLNADRVQIEQVIMNYVRNAVDAYRSLPPEQRKVTIRTELVGDEVRIEVSDFGTGVEPSLRSEIFEPFVSGRSSGLGMGLAICKRIAEVHGGTVGVSDNTPQGSKFWISLPCH
ncbi:MAG: PAS domain S-box protein [Pseudomonadota bacterium]